MESTLKTPEELKEPYFTLETSLEPTNLVQASQLLLSSLSSKLKQSFRLVVTFLEEKACFRLCLDASLWFDVYIRSMSDFSEAVNIARQYVTTTRLNNLPEELLFEKPSPNIVYLTESYLLNREFVDQGDYPVIVCKGKTETRGGRNAVCNYYFATSFVVNELSNEKYVVMLRREPLRELLLIPRPNDKEEENYGHYTNETLVQQESFWEDLLSKRESLCFHSIAIQYGAWETGQSQNKYEQECHAHVHLYFTLGTWNGVKEKIRDIEVLLKFNASYFPGPNNLLNDCIELEEKRLRPAEHLLMVRSLSNYLKSSEGNGDKVLKRYENNFEKIISTMNENTARLIKAIEGLGEI